MMKSMKLMRSLEVYEHLLAPARERFAASPGLKVIQSSLDAVFLESFLMHFCAMGLRMTEPVEGWIRRAAERCTALGLSELAWSLIQHAQSEAGHHLMMIADVRSLAARWNARHKPSVDADELLNRAPSPGVLRYCQVHEENIAGDTPYAQIAIEYEIEMLPVRYGELFIARCIEVLGIEILPCLSFVTEHIDLDVGHTKFNARALAKLINLSPRSVSALVTAGTAALDAYAQFLSDCAQLAERHARQAHRFTNSSPPSLTWHLRLPLWRSSYSEGHPLPDWLEDVRSLRGSILFDNGRRPHFRTEDGSFFDPDPIDLYAYHVLAYDSTRLVGCVRVYHLVPNGPLCVTEEILGEKAFSEILLNLGGQREETVEIGRWIVHPEFHTNGLTMSLGAQLAAGSAALAIALANGLGVQHGIAVCSAGTEDRQDLMLARIGLTAVPGIEPVNCDDYNDNLRVMYCTGNQQLNPRFLRVMDEMAKKLRLTQTLFEDQPNALLKA
jgi:hypothetical protein